jgi:hypothetical protein
VEEILRREIQGKKESLEATEDGESEGFEGI